MTSEQIRTLLSPPSQSASTSRAVLYLNSKFSTVEDFINADKREFDALEERRNALEHELERSQESIDVLLEETRKAAHERISEARELALERHQLADELGSLSRALQEPHNGETTLYQDIDSLHRSLKELESVKGYVGVIKRALEMSESAVAQIQSLVASPQYNLISDSLSNYVALQTFVEKLNSATHAALREVEVEGELHLVRFLGDLLQKTWDDIKALFANVLLTAAEKLRWPMAVDYPSCQPQNRSNFERAFQDLMKLQNLRRSISPNEKSAEAPYPLQALVQPLSLRFKYHFEGARKTNKIDKPEWFFTHILNVVHEHRPFMDHVAQSLLARDPLYKETSAWREFTLLLLPLLTRKLTRTAPSLPPALLAHTIYQALAFDAALVEEGFSLPGGEDWKGVSDVILGHPEWFQKWLEGEKQFAEEQYQEIISSPDAWQIEDDEHDGGTGSLSVRTTHSARRLKALLEQITDRYVPLSSVAQQRSFFSSIQLPLLDAYRSRIKASLDAFETLSSALVRAVPGALGVSLTREGNAGMSVNIETQRLTSGVEGAQRLCKALVSIEGMVGAMTAWEEEVVFLEMWHHMSETEHQAGSSVFEPMIKEYRSLGKHAEDVIVLQVCGEVEVELKPHLSSSPSEMEEEIGVSQSLLPALALLSTHLTYLKAALSPKNESVLIGLYRRISSRLGEHILQRQLLYRGGVTLREGQGILRETELWVETCFRALGTGVGRARVQSPWDRLSSAARVAASDGERWDTVLRLLGGSEDEEEWDEQMSEALGAFGGLSREEVARLIRRRQK